MQHFEIPRSFRLRAPVGAFALCLMLLAEYSVVRFLSDMSISKYLLSHDPVSGSVYLLMLLVFGAMPYTIASSSTIRRSSPRVEY